METQMQLEAVTKNAKCVVLDQNHPTASVHKTAANAKKGTYLIFKRTNALNLKTVQDVS